MSSSDLLFCEDAWSKWKQKRGKIYETETLSFHSPINESK